MDFVKKKLRYKNNKTFYQKIVLLRVFAILINFKKNIFFFSFWTKNDTCEDILQKYAKRGVKKPKKWILPPKKLKYKKNKLFYQKIRLATFFTTLINFKKKTFFHFRQKMTPVRIFYKKKTKFHPF